MKKEVEIEFKKEGIVLRQNIPTPFGGENVEKVYPYQDIYGKKWDLRVYEVKPNVVNGILKSIIIKGEIEVEDEEKIDVGYCIEKYIPYAKGQSLNDLKDVVKYMCKERISRKNAVKRVADKDSKTYGAVLSNITRTLNMKTRELDEKLEKIIECCKKSQP